MIKDVKKRLRKEYSYAIIIWFGKETGANPVRARRRDVQNIELNR